MKIEDCEVGMKLECLEENYPNGFHKGDVLTVKEIINKAVRFEKSRFTWNICSFKPANKFEVGDEVIWQNDKVKIWGIRYDDEIKEYEYAIEDFLENVGRTIVFESELSPLKKKDELEVGDKFRSVGNRTIKVLDKKFDELHNEMVYFGKCENGLISVWSEYEVDEIIYE